jgi:hypothetical protein
MTLYVATDLSRREIPPTEMEAGADAPDLRIDGRLFRVLSPDYYAFLRTQMARVKAALDAGTVDAATYRPLADRFNTVHMDAVHHFGEDTLRAAMRSFNLQAYRVPGDGGTVIEMPSSPRRGWDGQGTLAGFETAPPAIAMPIQIGQRVRTFGTEVTVTGYHAPDEDFPGGWIDVVTEAGVTGSADLRFAKDLHGQALVPMILTADEQRIAAMPDEPFELTDADLDVSDLPEPHFYPTGDDPALRFYQPVSPRAVELVDAIRARAMALGWTEAQLYQNRSRLAYPYGQEYGLVCSLRRDDTIGDITADAVTLISARPHAAPLRHMRPPQPSATTIIPEVTP